MVAQFEVRHVLDIKAELGEAPLWSVEQDTLYWLDIDRKTLNRFDPATGKNRAWDVPAQPGCFNFREGGLLIASTGGYLDFDFTTEKFDKVCDAPFDGTVFRFNDGKADRQGRLWAGTLKHLIDTQGAPEGTFYCFDRGEVKVGIHPIMVPNGTAFSPDGTVMYRSDWRAEGKVLLRYDYDPATGTPSNERTFAVLPADYGVGDGAAVDTEAHYWCAIPYGDKGRVGRFTPDGKLDLVIEMPVLGPTMTSFGGRDMSTLYVTSARLETMMGRESELSAQSGDIFAIDTGFKGVPESFTKLS